jgi:hypothetical protein
MTNSSPIPSPPPELRKLWAQQAQRLTPHDITGWLDYVATQAAQWGADQELEACCNYFEDRLRDSIARDLRTARRPKPPSLKEQALTALHAVATGANDIREQHQDLDTIRRALEALPND